MFHLCFQNTLQKFLQLRHGGKAFPLCLYPRDTHHLYTLQSDFMFETTTIWI